MMFLDCNSPPRTTNILSRPVINIARRFILVDAMYRDVPVMWCPYIYVDNDAALARGGRRGFQRKWVAFFRRVPLRLRPRAAPVASGSRFGASLSAHGSVLRKPASPCTKPVENGMSLPVDPRSCAILPRLAAGHQTSLRHELAMSITDNLTVVGAWIGKGELNFRKRMAKNSKHSPEQDRVRVSLLNFLLVTRSEDPRRPWLVSGGKYSRRNGEASSPRPPEGSPGTPSRGDARRGDVLDR